MLEVPGVAREEHRVAIVILRQVALMRIGKPLQLGGIVGGDPACGVQHGGFECHRYVVFRSDPVGEKERKSVVWGKSVSVRVDLGGRRIIKQKNDEKANTCIETNQ